MDWSTPSYQFTKNFSNGVGRDLLCEMDKGNGGWIVSRLRYYDFELLPSIVQSYENFLCKARLLLKSLR